MSFGWRIHLFLFAPVVATCFLPLYLGESVVDQNAPFQNSLLDPGGIAEISFATSIAVCVPMLVDILLDYFSPASSTLYIFDRLMLLFGCSFHAIVFFILKTYLGHSNIGTGCACMYVAQKIFIAIPLISLVRSSQSGVFNLTGVLAMFIIFAATQILALFWFLNEPAGLVFFILAWVVTAIGYVVYSYHVLKYVGYILTFRESLAVEEWIPLLVVIIMTVLIISLTILFAIIGRDSYEAFSPAAVAFSNFSMSGLAIFATVFPGRIARFQVADQKRVLTLKQSFVRFVSHELRTPMNVSTVGLSLLQDSLVQLNVFHGEVAETVVQVKDALSAAGEILNDLLTYEKLSSNMMTLDLSLETPLLFVKSCLNLLTMQARASAISFSIEVDGDSDLRMYRIEVDKLKMRQVLRNLVSNSLSFTPANGSVKVTLSLIRPKFSPISLMAMSRASSKGLNSLSSKFIIPAESGGSAKASASTKKASAFSDQSSKGRREWLRISVEDTGAGIDLENLSRVFNEVMQFQPNQLHGGQGTGLGLFISKGIVELHGGQISVYSDGPGKGSVFNVDLPVVCIDGNPESLYSEHVPHGPGEGGGGGGGGGGGSGKGSGSHQHNKPGVHWSHSLATVVPLIVESVAHPEVHALSRQKSEQVILEDFDGLQASVVDVDDASTHRVTKWTTSTRVALDKVVEGDERGEGRGSDRNLGEEVVVAMPGSARSRPGEPLSRGVSQARMENTGEVDQDRTTRLRSFVDLESGLGKYGESDKSLLSATTPRHVAGGLASHSSSNDSSNKSHSGGGGGNRIHRGAVTFSANANNVGVLIDYESVDGSDSQMHHLSTAGGRSCSVVSLSAVDSNKLAQDDQLTGKRFLVVDDSAVNRKMVMMMLKRLGAVCVEAEDGQKALDILVSTLPPPRIAESHQHDHFSHSRFHMFQRAHAPSAEDPGHGGGGGGGGGAQPTQSSRGEGSALVFDAVIMDNMMPVMMGPESCSLMRRAGYDKLILGLTGHALPQDIKTYLEAGANHVFKKPIDVKEFVAFLVNFNGN